MHLNTVICEFASAVQSGDREIYNEFSLQHELGSHLRERLRNHRVRFEVPVDSLFPNARDRKFAKKEIDIAVTAVESGDKVLAIEVKYPRNGQYPEQMFQFCRDLQFVEELCRAGFRTGASLVFVDDPLFWEGRESRGVYRFFRGADPIKGEIQKPTGNSRSTEEPVHVAGCYTVEWRRCGDRSYYLLEVTGQAGNYST